MTGAFVLGVDGGQTHLKCVLATTAAEVVGWGESLGVRHLASDEGATRLAQSLRNALEAAWTNAGLAPRPVIAAVVGMATLEAGTPEAAQARAIAREILGTDRVDVYSDAHIALIGAHEGKPGIIVIAGTGSHVRGVNAKGETARAGGWGWLLGDEGSAMWIGRAGVQAATYAEDGTGPRTALGERLCDHLNLSALEEIKRIVYRTGFGASDFAALASVVSQAAQTGDAVARSIIQQAGQALAHQAWAVHCRLSLPPDAPVAVVGGAFEHVAFLREAFTQALHALNPQAQVTLPRHPPAVGAALLALARVRAQG